MIEDMDTKKQVAHMSYKNMENFKVQIMHTNKYYTNPNSIHICFPMEATGATNDSNDISTDLIPVTNFCCQLIKEISITKYRNNKHLMSIFFTMTFINILMLESS